MRKKYKILTAIFFLFIGFSVSAQQNSAGKMFYVDYDIWKDEGYPGIYVKCPHHDSLNLGSEFTLEVWLRAYTFGENRKVFGKMTDDFNNGYVLGFENLQVYTEVFNPANHHVPRGDDGYMPVDSVWLHLASTYNGYGQLINYVNGKKVGEITVFPPGPIIENESPFIIGLAPWDEYSFEFTGGLDELRVWNVEKSESEIQQNMFNELSGNESNLVAYFNFNSDADSTVNDAGPNSINGVLKNSNSPAFTWANSDAPIGNSTMAQQFDIEASWYGKGADFNYATTENGFSLINSIEYKEFWKYIIFGHNNKSGKTSENAPSDADDSFERLQREWYVNTAGGFESDLVFDIAKASPNSETINTNGTNKNYVLLTRNNIDEAYKVVATANVAMQGVAYFTNIKLKDKFYTLGYSTKELQINSLNTEDYLDAISIYPNPAENFIFVQTELPVNIIVYNIMGKIVYAKNLESGKTEIDLSGLGRGMYVIKAHSENQIFNSKIILK
ncbi:MAG: T9SS type A sorting domain-containing protein [Bacteroidales bacterium]|nr:T9SS type A sorting domain-containing protein [Bacteroidales bacterium]